MSVQHISLWCVDYVGSRNKYLNESLKAPHERLLKIIYLDLNKYVACFIGCEKTISKITAKDFQVG